MQKLKPTLVGQRIYVKLNIDYSFIDCVAIRIYGF